MGEADFDQRCLKIEARLAARELETAANGGGGDDDAAFGDLAPWVAVQRMQHKHGRMTAPRAARLKALGVLRPSDGGGEGVLRAKEVADEVGATPLIVAARWGKPAIVKWLLGFGADPRSRRARGGGAASPLARWRSRRHRNARSQRTSVKHRSSASNCWRRRRRRSRARHGWRRRRSALGDAAARRRGDHLSAPRQGGGGGGEGPRRARPRRSRGRGACKGGGGGGARAARCGRRSRRRAARSTPPRSRRRSARRGARGSASTR